MVSINGLTIRFLEGRRSKKVVVCVKYIAGRASQTDRCHGLKATLIFSHRNTTCGAGFVCARGDCCDVTHYFMQSSINLRLLITPGPDSIIITTRLLIYGVDNSILLADTYRDASSSSLQEIKSISPRVELRVPLTMSAESKTIICFTA